MLSGDEDALLLFTTCPERENNRSHGTARRRSMVHWEGQYLKASLEIRHIMAHISVTFAMDTKLCQFLVLFYNVLKLFSAVDTSQESLTSTGAKEIHHLDPTSLIGFCPQTILRPGGPTLMHYPQEKIHPSWIRKSCIFTSLLHPIQSIPGPESWWESNIKPLLATTPTVPDSGNVLALPVTGYVLQIWLNYATYGHPMFISAIWLRSGLCTQ